MKINKKIGTYLLLTLGTTLTLLIAFYIFSLKPKLELPRKLLESERTLSSLHSSLLQNRLALMAIASLDPNSSQLASEKNSALKLAIDSKEKGLQALKEGGRVQLPKDLKDQFPQLLSANEEIYINQEAFLKELEKINDINKNIYAYNPLLDLGFLDANQNREEILKRTKSAVDGLEKIKQKTQNQQLQNKIAETQDLLEIQKGYLENNDVTNSSLTFKKVVDSFAEMREIGLGMEFNVIKSPEMIKILTDQTNLLLKYEFWLERINKEQEKLPNVNLNDIF